MKKLILSIAIGLVGMSAYAQTFNGIEVGLPYAETNQVLINKGFKQTEVVSEDMFRYKGMVNGSESEVIIVRTPQTKMVWKLVVYVSENTTWSTTKSQYEKYRQILVDKYGNPTDDYQFFSTPYYAGDGYEMQALYKDKATFVSYFEDPNKNSIGCEVVSYTYGIAKVKVSYENKVASDLYTTEKKELANKTF